MPYEFRPPGIRTDTNKVLLVVFSVLVLLVLYSVGNILTGYTTYAAKIEQQLNQTSEELKIISAAREECAKELNDKASQYQECSSGLKSSEAGLNSCRDEYSQFKTTTESALNQCRTELTSLKSNQSSVYTSYKNLIKNSVKSICCTVSDVDSAMTKQWRVEGDRIICSGNFTVNCATGETNYS